MNKEYQIPEWEFDESPSQVDLERLHRELCESPPLRIRVYLTSLKNLAPKTYSYYKTWFCKRHARSLTSEVISSLKKSRQGGGSADYRLALSIEWRPNQTIPDLYESFKKHEKLHGYELAYFSHMGWEDCSLPNYTTSTEVALSLIKEEYKFVAQWNEDEAQFTIEGYDADTVGKWTITATAHTLPLAICIVALQMIQVLMERKGRTSE